MNTAQAPGPGQGRDGVVESTAADGPCLALTFDDGPHPEHTPRLLSVLREHGVTAVFCLCGAQVREHPGIARDIAAGGHLLGNHSMHHDDMGEWPEDRIRADLQETGAAIRAAVPGASVPYFRAPYGNWGLTPGVAATLGMVPLGWRLAVADWEVPGTGELVRRLEDGVTPGAVVLLHDGGGDRSRTVDAVARLLPRLKARGWRFTEPARTP
jgi:peptidoglycan-N-acetylglucosamine deacetylase